jgi:cysteine desulfurase
MHTYLDYASSTPIDPKVLEEYLKASNEAWANPSSYHGYGQKAKNYLEDSRRVVAEHFQVKPIEVYFTSSATEANNLVFYGVVGKFLNRLEKDIKNSNLRLKPEKIHVLISAIEHDSVLKFKNRFDPESVEVELVEVSSEGLIDPDLLISKIKENTILISLIWVNNEIGTIQPVREVAKKLEKLNISRKKKGFPKVLFHTDASQAINYLEPDFENYRPDLLTFSGQKIYAPKGAACLIVKEVVYLKPFIMGGGQESNLRSGTENVPAIWALARALKLCESTRKQESERLLVIRDYLVKRVLGLISGSSINGFWNLRDSKKRIVNNINFAFESVNLEELLTYLDLHGFAVSSGSGCHSGSLQKSSVLKAIGVDQKTTENLRISLGRQTKKEEIKELTETLERFWN